MVKRQCEFSVDVYEYLRYSEDLQVQYQCLLWSMPSCNSSADIWLAAVISVVTIISSRVTVSDRAACDSLRCGTEVSEAFAAHLVRVFFRNEHVGTREAIAALSRAVVPARLHWRLCHRDAVGLCGYSAAVRHVGTPVAPVVLIA